MVDYNNNTHFCALFVSQQLAVERVAFPDAGRHCSNACLVNSSAERSLVQYLINSFSPLPPTPHPLLPLPLLVKLHEKSWSIDFQIITTTRLDLSLGYAVRSNTTFENVLTILSFLFVKLKAPYYLVAFLSVMIPESESKWSYFIVILDEWAIFSYLRITNKFLAQNLGQVCYLGKLL